MLRVAAVVKAEFFLCINKLGVFLMLIWAHGLDKPKTWGGQVGGQRTLWFLCHCNERLGNGWDKGPAELVHCFGSYIFHFMYHGANALTS